MRTRARKPLRAEQANSPLTDLVSIGSIRRLTRQIANQFNPEKIILFGSYAYGTPNIESDVDLLVIMPARNEIDAACRIRQAVHHPFPLDLIVRTPSHVRSSVNEGDSFLREIMERGKVLHEANDKNLDAQGGKRSRRGAKSAGFEAAAS